MHKEDEIMLSYAYSENLHSSNTHLMYSVLPIRHHPLLKMLKNGESSEEKVLKK